MFKHCDICFLVVHVVQHACTGLYFVKCAVRTGRQYELICGTIACLDAIVPGLCVFVAERPLGH